MSTSYLPPQDILTSPLLHRDGTVNGDAVTDITTAARDADTAARAAHTAACDVATRARHAARLYVALTRGGVKNTAAAVQLSPRVWADILTGNRDATPGESQLIAETLAALAPDAS